MADEEPTHEIISRKDAKAKGLKHYFTGKFCKNGHVSIRRIDGSCIECQRVWGRAWEKANPDLVAKKNKRKYDRNPEKPRLRSRIWYINNKEKAKETRKLYMLNSGDVVREKSRRSSANYREKFPEKSKQQINDWWARNPERKKTYARNRRANKRGNGGNHTQAEVNDIFKSQRGKCAYCKTKLGKATNMRHVDHIIPLINGGTNDRRNLQILCQPCNLEKGRRDPIDHARKLGMLL